MKKERVVVAMSGGVDSSVAAALLIKQGYEVIGITMCFSAVGGSASGGNLPEFEPKKPRCCGIQGIEDARAVAHQLGIKHYVLNMQKALEEKVIKNFCLEYSKGRTPNPCVRCNQYIKFDALLRKALSLGAKYLATGHYARIAKGHKAMRPQGHWYYLKKAKDSKKDQSYFLYRLGQKQLKHLLFPLGDYTKKQVRKLAKEFDLPVAEKKESQEICFLPGDDYRDFLGDRLKTGIQSGLIVDTKEKVLGRHKGIAFYTIGQRSGLEIACGYPVYVTHIDAGHNRIVLGKKEEAMSREFLVKDVHWVNPVRGRTPEASVDNLRFPASNGVKVKIRYNHKEAPAKLIPENKKIRVICAQPQFAVTPGQSAVFYRGDTVLGGGIIV